MNIADSILYIEPNAEFSCGETLDSIEWFSKDIKKPSNDAIIDAWEKVKKHKLIQSYALELTKLFNKKARSKNYKNELSIASYATSNNTVWKQEAVDFIKWRDACWDYAIKIQNDVESGAIEPPSIDNFIANAPVLNW